VLSSRRLDNVFNGSFSIVVAKRKMPGMQILKLAKEKSMFKASTVCLFLLVALFAGIAPAHAASIASEAASSTQGANQRPYIIKEVRHEIMLLPQYSLFDWIEYEVRPDNSVVLRGQVRGFTLKADAETAVKHIEGVTSVVNEIENLPESSSDDQIRRNVYRAIYAEDGPLFRYAIEVVPTIHIIVKNGNVTLKGVVHSKSDSDFAYLKARGVSGTFSVKNELTVEKH
jgi:hyperosmotically inducible periplasmic protein